MSGHSQHLPPTPIPTTEPKLICHPQSFLPMVEPLVTTWMGDAADSKEYTLDTLSSKDYTRQPRTPSTCRGGTEQGRAPAGEKAAQEKHGQEGPRQPAAPASQGCRWGEWAPDSCQGLWLPGALESPGPGRRP